MSPAKLTALIDEGIALDRRIAADEERLKQIKATLIENAEASPDELTMGEGGGQVWTGQSSAGEGCRVSFPIPTLKSALKSTDKALPKAKDLAGRFFEQLFRPEVIYKPADNFRDRASEFLERKDANALIRACSSKTTPKVSFETKTEKEAV